MPMRNMIQTLDPAKVHYSARLMGGAPDARLARERQSADAEELLRLLRLRTGLAAGPSSKAHARALAAAAASAGAPIGIDVEYLAPARPIRAIGQWLMDAAPRDDLTAYRAFTFREAYFKAFGAWPEKALLRRIAAERESIVRTKDGLSVLHERFSADFVLTLVWRGDGTPTFVDV